MPFVGMVAPIFTGVLIVVSGLWGWGAAAEAGSTLPFLEYALDGGQAANSVALIMLAGNAAILAWAIWLGAWLTKRHRLPTDQRKRIAGLQAASVLVITSWCLILAVRCNEADPLVGYGMVIAGPTLGASGGLLFQANRHLASPRVSAVVLGAFVLATVFVGYYGVQVSDGFPSDRALCLHSLLIALALGTWLVAWGAQAPRPPRSEAA